MHTMMIINYPKVINSIVMANLNNGVSSILCKFLNDESLFLPKGVEVQKIDGTNWFACIKFLLVGQYYNENLRRWSTKLRY